jgi:tripartite-type tricarboxylate transporter receptor subunit TctC
MGEAGRFAALAVVCVLAWTGTASAEAVDFKGQTISMVVGAEPGGGTDTTARMIAPFFEKYLPGKPTIVIRNRPGAGGVTALNYVVQQTKPDGLTLIGGGNAQLSPVTYRKSGVYDPRNFLFIGGLGRGGTVLIVNKEHEKRLYDKSQPPLFYGALDGTRSGEQVVFWGMEYLGWNAKIVIGYRGTNELSIAMDRGEVDMHTTSAVYMVKKLMETGRFDIIGQSGMLVDGKYAPRPDFPDTPVIGDMIGAKITNPVARQAFDYLQSFTATDKWIGLREGTPDGILQAYRVAFNKIVVDPDFLARTSAGTEDMAPQKPKDLQVLVDQMAALTEDAEEYIKTLQRSHGLDVK